MGNDREAGLVAIPNDVLTFWRNAGPEKWFAKTARFDEAIRIRFEPVHHMAARGEYDEWGLTPEGALALVILLDQFPRNLYRDSGHAFATDGKALAVARAATDRGWHKVLDTDLRSFVLKPFQHSEDLVQQDRGLILAMELGDVELLKWTKIHHEIIARFGRFPHRNPVLGRETTTDEHRFLNEGGFRG